MSYKPDLDSIGTDYDVRVEATFTGLALRLQLHVRCHQLLLFRGRSTVRNTLHGAATHANISRGAAVGTLTVEGGES